MGDGNVGEEGESVNQVKKEDEKRKKADEKICADCQSREHFTSICKTLGFKVKRTELTCNSFNPTRRI